MCLSVHIPCNQSVYISLIFFVRMVMSSERQNCKLSVATGELCWCFSSFVKKSALKWNISSQTFIQTISSAHLLCLSETASDAICTSIPVLFRVWKEGGGMPACTDLRCESDTRPSFRELKLLISVSGLLLFLIVGALRHDVFVLVLFFPLNFPPLHQQRLALIGCLNLELKLCVNTTKSSEDKRSQAAFKIVILHKL